MRESNPDNDDAVVELAFGDRRLHQLMLAGLNQGVCIVDREGKILFWNRAAERISGFLGQEVAGQAIRGDLLLHASTYRPLLAGEDLAGGQEACGRCVTETVLLLHRDGHRVLASLQSYPIHTADGEAAGAVDVFRELVPAGEQGVRDYEVYGCSDVYTNCAKRAYGELAVEHALAMLNEFGIPFGWLRIGLDRAEDLDRTFGHGMVEAAVKMAAAALDRNLGAQDVLARWGDSELRVLIHRCTHPELAAAAERLCLLVRTSSLDWWGDRRHVAVCIGGATAEPGDTLELLEGRANGAFEGCRAAGGDRAAIAQMTKGGGARCSQ